MKNKETFTIVNYKTGQHYDTNDERFYDESWERTQDFKSYLDTLIKNNPDKFQEFKIENNDT